MEVNYKLKYNELKLRFISALDVSFRTGYEAGSQAAQIEAQQQQMQMQADQAAQAQQQPGQPGEEQPEDGQEQPQDQQHPEGSELQRHIDELESMVKKSEITPMDLKKSLDSLKAYKSNMDLNKSLANIRKIKMPRTPLVLSKTAAHNMPEASQKALTAQETLVSEIMTEWGKQEAKASKSIFETLAEEGLVSKE